jgi:hypothetical protein
VLLIVAADVEQAIVALDRIEAKLRVSPIMRQLVKARTPGRRGEVNADFDLTANRIPPAADGGCFSGPD